MSVSESAPTIFVLDDDLYLAQGMARFLDRNGVAAKAFTQPTEFLDHARTHPVPVAVVDVWMPDASGLEVLTELRQMWPGTRIIIITGRDEYGVKDAAMSGGAFAFLSKPFDSDDFLKTVLDAFEAPPGSARQSQSSN
jgi:FixJ family two-component response regulator